MKIKNAKLKDSDAILNLNQEHFEFEEKYTDVFRTDWSLSKSSRKELVGRLQNDNFIILIAQNKEQVVGYAICEIEQTPKRILDKLFTIHTFFVTKEYRRQGVGTKLIEECVKIAKGKNIKRVRLETLINNQSAIDFYEKMGFTKFTLGMEKNL